MECFLAKELGSSIIDTQATTRYTDQVPLSITKFLPMELGQLQTHTRSRSSNGLSLPHVPVDAYVV